MSDIIKEETTQTFAQSEDMQITLNFADRSIFLSFTQSLTSILSAAIASDSYNRKDFSNTFCLLEMFLDKLD